MRIIILSLLRNSKYFKFHTFGMLPGLVISRQTTNRCWRDAWPIFLSTKGTRSCSSSTCIVCQPCCSGAYLHQSAQPYFFRLAATRRFVLSSTYGAFPIELTEELDELLGTSNKSNNKMMQYTNDNSLMMRRWAQFLFGTAILSSNLVEARVWR